MDQPLSTLRPEPLRPDDHVIGPDSASVTVIAYCDFECPFCGQAFVRTKRLRERFEHQLRLVYRHFPLIDGIRLPNMPPKPRRPLPSKAGSG